MNEWPHENPEPEGRCVRCHEEIPLVFGDCLGQYDNALTITLHGGYGELIDVIQGTPVPEYLLCYSCAHELIDSFAPAIGKHLRRYWMVDSLECASCGHWKALHEKLAGPCVGFVDACDCKEFK